jgi:asparagine synthase (glutamine-hydrolysing)
MCGICGIAGSHLDRGELEATIARMVDALSHRGPDGQDARLFFPPSTKRPVALGHARLAIIDLSSAGREPIGNESGSVWLIFNGEIYNFPELREELLGKGHAFQSRTDAEVIVHLYEECGPACLERLNGMFAFALLDLEKQKLLLARDRLGIKPLYYWPGAGGFLFASEIKSILASSLYRTEVNWQAVFDYFTFLYVPCPETIFAGIQQLPPAHRLIFDLATGGTNLERYWQVNRRPEVERASERDLREMTRELAADCVKRQLISDVPLGVFLSGGIDSTIVTGLAKENDAAVHTFTVIFEGEEFAYYNEREMSLAVSRHLGTQHRELLVPPVDPAEILNLVEQFDQPFGNPTFYLMYLISKYAREHITVALCGAGGDELYAGYPRYRAAQLARRLRWIPRPALSAAKGSLNWLRDSYATMRLRRARKFLEGLDGDFARQFVRWTYFFEEGTKEKLFAGGNAGNSHSRGFAPSERFLRAALEGSALSDPDNRMLHADVQTFLLDNLLEYTDKMSMAVALEVRVPLLDHRFVEFSLNVPFSQKLSHGQSKRLLRETFAEFFPPAARKAPKRGFNAPLARWMLDVFDGYFEEDGRARDRLQSLGGSDLGASWKEGILDWQVIQQLREQHKRGRRDNSYELFAIILFDVWWRKYVKGTFQLVSSKSARASSCAY